MCLTGVDYFSTLGYQPGIAFLAAGALSPIATLILILLTLFGALPIYRRVAEQVRTARAASRCSRNCCPAGGARSSSCACSVSPRPTSSSPSRCRPPTPRRTSSAIRSCRHRSNHPVALTLVLLAMLSAVFLKGFREAIGFAVFIVAIYLALNVVVIGWGIIEVAHHPEYFPRWRDGLMQAHGNPMMMLAAALIVFPKLALGLSGFETGVAVMPLVQGDPGDDPARPAGRIRNTKKLLRTAALIMTRAADGQLDHHDAADPAARVRSRRPRRGAARWRSSRTNISARCSGRSTT